MNLLGRLLSLPARLVSAERRAQLCASYAADEYAKRTRAEAKLRAVQEELDRLRVHCARAHPEARA